MTASKRILVLSVSAGAGHTQAAQALSDTAHTRFPDWQVEHVDVMAWCRPLFSKVYSGGYMKIVARAPLVWAGLYTHSDKARPAAFSERVRRWLQHWGMHRAESELQR
ncbi:MAG: galactosyldiacylglycerol synthase, partial [Brachymonas sp.]|nr:galactosyldiacylglycerol synthase [Brachymonas sp.]